MEITSVKLQPESGYILNEDMFVPEAADNRHYQAIQDWIAEGNTPADAD